MTIIDFRQAARRIEPARQSLARALDDFLADCRVAGAAERTMGNHAAELRRYDAWLAETGRAWATVQPPDCAAYLRTRAHLGRSSRANAITSLRAFYRWAAGEGFVTESPARLLKTPARGKRVPKALSQDDALKLLDYLKTLEAGTLAQRRDRALVLTGLYAGLRAAELAGLTWTQLDLSGALITLPESKMARGRVVRMHPVLVGVLADWKTSQGGGGSVFGCTGQPIVANRAGKIVTAVSRAAGLTGVTAHVLRHTFATWSQRRSGNIYAVSKAMGHSRLETTMIYLRSDPRDGDPAVLALPGLGDWSGAPGA